MFVVSNVLYREKKSKENSISCEGASPYLIFTTATSKFWDIKINEVEYDTGNLDIITWISSAVIETGLIAIDLSEMGCWGLVLSEDASDTKIILTLKDSESVIEFFESDELGITSNPAAYIQDNKVYACLSNNVVEINLINPVCITNDSAAIVAKNQDDTVGIYPLLVDADGAQVDTDTNLLAVAGEIILPDVKIAGNDSVILSYGLKFSRNDHGLYDTELSFDPQLTGYPSFAVNNDGSYILIASLGDEQIQIYKKESASSYVKIGQLTDFFYFSGLSFSPDGAKFSYISHLPSRKLIVANIQNGVSVVSGSIDLATGDGLNVLTSHANSVTWFYDNIIAISYVLGTNEAHIQKGYIDILTISNDEVILRERIEIGAMHYGFGEVQSGRCLLTSSTGELRLICIDNTGMVEFNVDYSEFANRYCVLKPCGTQLILNSQTPKRVDIITINDDGTYIL